ncbi:RNA polymerase sigma factor [Streptomyces sp. NPDC058257]|uniref:RNA polymerase sigma factor n=1 Tax=Streptomyces sp. NPDC058257 TaxID=3346409 RepID=UPI0036E95E0A
MSLSHSGRSVSLTGALTARRARSALAGQQSRSGALPVDDRLGATVAAARKGDEDAFRMLYRSLHPQLLMYAEGLVGTALAAGVESRAWEHIARNLANFQGDGGDFRGWCALVLRTGALEHPCLKDRRRPDGDESARPAERTLSLIARLPQEQAEALLLLFVVRLDLRQTAGVLGRRARTVRTAAHRGMRGLAKLLGGTAVPEVAIRSTGPQGTFPAAVRQTQARERPAGTRRDHRREEGHAGIQTKTPADASRPADV